MTQPKTITATYKIVTPMFIGGADHKADSIRAPSVKGALRFWWRALNWGNFYQKSAHNREDALKNLHQKESEIFGNTPNEKNKKIGQSKFILRVEEINSKKTSSYPAEPSSSAYLGYGLLEDNKNKKRNAIDCGGFRLRLVFNPEASEQEISSVKDSLIALGLFGGLGSRSRNGFGSIAIESIDKESYRCANVEDYKSLTTSLLNRCDAKNIPLPPYTAFSQHTEISHIGGNKNYAMLHNEIGGKYKDFRGKIERKERIPFGLPLADEDINNRRASPLFIHLHPIQSGGFFGVFIHIPATFLSAGDYPAGKNIAFFNQVSSLVKNESQEVFYPCQ